MTKRRSHIAAAAMVLAVCLLASATARAHILHTTTAGKPVHWARGSVDFVISPSLAQIAPDALTAVAAAMSGWSGADGAPTLRVQLGDGSEKPGVDGKNVVYFAPDGYPSARGALAITILSYDEASGDLVDADIVVNGNHALAILPEGAEPRGALVATDVSGGASATARAGEGGAFDLLHVVMHETGHALGLKDEPDVAGAAMYPFTYRNDATRRAPTDDDLAGIRVAYLTTATSSASPTSSGCASSPAAPRDGQAVLALAIAVSFVARRRLRRAARC